MVREEENRQSVDIFGGNWNLLFPGKASYHLLNGDYPVIIMSMTHHARVMQVEALLPGHAKRDTSYFNCNLHEKITANNIDWKRRRLVNLGWSHTQQNYKLHRSVDDDDCLAQFSSKYVLKEEQRQAVFGLLKPGMLWRFFQRVLPKIHPIPRLFTGSFAVNSGDQLRSTIIRGPLWRFFFSFT